MDILIIWFAVSRSGETKQGLAFPPLANPMGQDHLASISVGPRGRLSQMRMLHRVECYPAKCLKRSFKKSGERAQWGIRVGDMGSLEKRSKCTEKSLLPRTSNVISLSLSRGAGNDHSAPGIGHASGHVSGHVSLHDPSEPYTPVIGNTAGVEG